MTALGPAVRPAPPRPAQRVWVLVSVLSLGLWACHGDEGPSQTAEQAEAPVDMTGQPVTPPFAVEGDCKGLLLVWFDEEGVHTADKRADVPAASRERVRVDSLAIPPDQRLDPEWVYVADLRAPAKGQAYAVRKMRRAAFDAIVDAATGAESQETVARGADANADVVIYGASWCAACKDAAAFFEEHGVPFVEKDIERDRQALAEMQEKAKQAGLRPSGIPVIDFRGNLFQGFNRNALARMIAKGARPI